MPAPIVPPPANDTGALTQPRTLQRWLDVNRITKLDRTQTFVTIPSFSIADSWNGYSDIVAVYDFEAPNNISLKGFTFPSSPNYALTVAYQDLDGNPIRYLLFDATGSNINMQLITYSGQLLLKNFRFEVWNTLQGISSQTTDLVIYTSKLGGVDYRYGNDSALVAADTIVTNFAASLTNVASVKDRMTVSNCGTGFFNGFYDVYKAIGGLGTTPVYIQEGQYYRGENIASSNSPFIVIYFDGSGFTWIMQANVGGLYYAYVSSQHVATPDLVTDWASIDNAIDPTPIIVPRIHAGGTLPLVYPNNAALKHN